MFFKLYYSTTKYGGIAQLGERLNQIQDKKTALFKQKIRFSFRFSILYR